MIYPSIKQPPSEKALYFRTLIFSLVLFGGFYAYTTWLKIPNVLNKSAADASIVLIGISMMLSGICYFWNMFDSLIRYRKHAGMMGWAFGITHMFLSLSTLQALFSAALWEKGIPWAALTGFIATVVFTIMAMISNTKMAQLLGGKWWRFILRTGYLAVILIFFHVVLLKSARWITWYEGGMQTPPSSSLIVTVFMVLVILMRIALWIALKRKAAKPSFAR